MPNPALEVDMARYRLKIEKKFEESFMNHNFKMPRKPTKSIRINYDDGMTMLDVETAMLITNRGQAHDN